MRRPSVSSLYFVYKICHQYFCCLKIVYSMELTNECFNFAINKHNNKYELILSKNSQESSQSYDFKNKFQPFQG